MKSARIFYLSTRVAILLAVAYGMALPFRVRAHDSKETGTQKRFATPDDAIAALREAAKAKDRTAMHEIFGPEVHDLMTGDEVQDRTNFEAFSKAVEEGCKPERDGNNRIILEIGADNWPFPIPLEKKHGQWYFDTAAGKEEIVSRHIGRGELNAIGVCREYVEAQQKYFSQARDGGITKYARKFKSTPGQKDGLFWETGPNEEQSPFTALVAEAHSEGYGTNHTAGPHAFHGYFFRVLKAQGSAAPGGRMSYEENGNMTKGFALVAYPERWERSGIMTFIVDRDGKVYQRNLGKNSVEIASKMTEYNPDRKWTPVDDKGMVEK